MGGIPFTDKKGEVIDGVEKEGCEEEMGREQSEGKMLLD